MLKNNNDSGNFSSFIDDNLVNESIKISRIIAFIFLVFIILNFAVNIFNISSLNFLFCDYSAELYFSLIFSLIVFFLITSKNNDKYLSKLKYLTPLIGIYCILVVLNLLNILNFHYFMGFSYDNLAIASFSRISLSFILISLILKKYIRFAQLLALINMILGLGGFLYFLQLNTFNLAIALYYFVFHIMLFYLFLFAYSDKGFIQIIHLTTSGSKLARNIIISIFIFTLIFSIIKVITEFDYDIFRNTLNIGIIFAIGSFVFLLILLFFYAYKINESTFKSKVAKDDLIKTELFYEKIIEYAADCFLVVDKDNYILYVNDAFVQLVGVEKEKLINKTFFHKTDKYNKELNDCYIDVLNNLKAKSLEFVQIYNPVLDKYNYLSGIFIPRFENGEFDGVIFSAVDVTDKKENDSALRTSISEKNKLLTEVHHRVKNNMQLIVSLLRLQSNKINDENVKLAILDSQNRVKSMALVHENLYNSLDSSGMDISNYLSVLVKQIESTYNLNRNIKFIVDCTHYSLNLDLAIPLGLIINELITNSIKYAFPEDQECFIKISLDKSENEFVLKVQDNGVGLGYSESNGTGVGTTLIQALIQQIDGSYDFVVDKGTTIIIKFKDSS